MRQHALTGLALWCSALSACLQGSQVDKGDMPGNATVGNSGGSGGVTGAGISGAAAIGGQAASGGILLPPGPDPSSLDSDDDGIPDDAEIAAGTNPLERDTDGDGCDDLLEATFGECNPETMVATYGCEDRVGLVLTMDSGTGERMDDLTTEIVALDGGFADDLRANATDVAPAAAGTLDELLALVSVEPGARVGYNVRQVGTVGWTGVRPYALRVTSAAGGLLAEGGILWRPNDCHRP